MDASYRQRMHPLIAAASVSVILVSMLGAAALTGVLPASRNALPQEKSLKQAPDVPLATQSPAVPPQITPAPAPAETGAVAAAPAPAVAAAAPPAAQSVGSPAPAPPRESLDAQPIPVTDNDQTVAAAPAPVSSSDGPAVKPAVPAENIATTSGSSAVGEGASGARAVAEPAKARYKSRTRHVAVLAPAAPVESPRIVPVYREPPVLEAEAVSPAAGGARTIAGIDATVSGNHEATPVDVAPPQKAPVPVATYPVVAPFYPARPVPPRAGAATASSAGPDTAARPRRQAMRAVPNEEPASQAYPRASATGDTGTAARQGAAAGQSLGDTIDRTVSVIVGVLGGGRGEPRPTQPRSNDPATDATYR